MANAGAVVIGSLSGSELPCEVSILSELGERCRGSRESATGAGAVEGFSPGGAAACLELLIPEMDPAGLCRSETAMCGSVGTNDQQVIRSTQTHANVRPPFVQVNLSRDCVRFSCSHIALIRSRLANSLENSSRPIPTQ